MEYPFPPKDYEDCAERAARDAKSKDALSVLLSVCRTNFVGRRKVGGGYTYYDSCQDRTFDIGRPNPTSDELSHIKKQCLAYLQIQSQIAAEEEESKRKAQQAAQEARAAQLQAAREAKAKAEAILQARKLAAIPGIHVTVKSFFDCGFNICTWMEVEVTNGSKEALSSISIGLSTVPTSRDACPSSYAKQKKLDVRLSPGEKRKTTIDFIETEFSKHPVCFKVLDVQFADG